MKVIPETSQRKDWPRLVSQVVKEQGKQIAAIEKNTVETLTFSPIAEPAIPVEGMTYLDSTTDKLRTFAGGVWNDHW